MRKDSNRLENFLIFYIEKLDHLSNLDNFTAKKERETSSCMLSNLRIIAYVLFTRQKKNIRSVRAYTVSRSIREKKKKLVFLLSNDG